MLSGSATTDYLLRSTIPAAGLAILLSKSKVFLLDFCSSSDRISDCHWPFKLSRRPGAESPRSPDTRGPFAKDDHHRPFHFYFRFQ